MIISVASGKGGTGKTTVTASLVSVWKKPVVGVDLDVEEPNLHLFLKPEIIRKDQVYLEIPVVDESKCTLCRMCSDLCQFQAIKVMGDTLLTFPEMCHGCGGCLAVCPEKALSPGKRELGTISRGRTAGDKTFLMGSLRVGEAMSPPLMTQVKNRLDKILGQDNTDAIIDAPPGVSCPAVCAVMDSDFIILVTEPTPFGFHDFKLAWESFSPMGKPMGVVINRSGLGDDSVYQFCAQKNLPILASIPFDREIARGYSKGRIISSLSPELKTIFSDLALAVQDYQPEADHA
ncbi:MAG: 4Fe-4S binding protein [Desulfonatronovibrio sp.]